MSLYIGIDQSTNAIYEGPFQYGHFVWPIPIISASTFVKPGVDKIEYPRRHDLFSFQYIFREDGFDAVSRTRRGRFYKRLDQQPQDWFIDPPPYLATEPKNGSQNQDRKRLYTYVSAAITNVVKQRELDKCMVQLGTEDQFSIWTIINLESIVTGEDLVTLKMRPTLGILPNLNTDLIPVERRETLQRLLDKFANEVFRSAPESVIDRARDAASAILGALNEQRGACGFEKDLGKQIKAMENAPKRIVLSSAEIVRLFHVRTKPSEKERLNLRAITEQDAEMAVNCIGTILCELGWARW